MDRVGIVSMYHGSRNYGGLLQAFALCDFLNKNGYNAEQIDLPPVSIDNNKRNLCNRYDFKTIVIKSYNKIYYYALSVLIDIFQPEMKKENIRKNQLLDEFRKDQIPHICLTDTLDKMNLYNDVFDFFICGSDQIWNPYAYRDEFFLKFVNANKLKIAYAASIARKSITAEEGKKLKEGVKNINVISVREFNSKNILNSLGIVGVDVVLDPTLLLDANRWDALTEKVNINKPYLFYYMLEGDINDFFAVKRIAQLLKLEIVAIPGISKNGMLTDLVGSYKPKFANSPFEFISLIKYADVVITDSFHASVFSFVFQKEVFFVECKSTDTLFPRIEILIDTFHCQDHYMKGINQNLILNASKIHFQRYLSDFEHLKLKSREFLLGNLENR